MSAPSSGGHQHGQQTFTMGLQDQKEVAAAADSTAILISFQDY